MPQMNGIPSDISRNANGNQLNPPLVVPPFLRPSTPIPEASFNRTGPVNQPPNKDLRCEPYAGQEPAFLRLNSVQPHTLFFPVAKPNFNNLSVQEIIDTLSEQIPPELLNSLKGVRLIGGSCYLSLGSDSDAQNLMRLPLRMRGVPLDLEDSSVGTMFLALGGVPHEVSDETVAIGLSHFGMVMGVVERRIYRGVDTGERFARLRPKLAIPRALWLGGCRVGVRVMRPEEISALSFARRKSFRSHLHIRLRPMSEDVEPPPPIPPLPVTTPSSSVTKSVPNLVPPVSEPSARPIGFSFTQSVPNLAVRQPTPEPPPTPPKPQFFSSSSASNVFLFPTTCNDPTARQNSANSPPQTSGPNPPQTSNTTTKIPATGRSQSTPPITQPQSSPMTIRRQTSQSDPETPKPPSPSNQKQKRTTRKSSKSNSPNETRKQNGDASSSSGQDSPTKPGRRRMSVYFKKNGSLRRNASLDHNDATAGDLTTTCSERERSNSDVSSRTSGGGCRRKMSTTGRENGKVPWCGCWGNGCI